MRKTKVSVGPRKWIHCTPPPSTHTHIHTMWLLDGRMILRFLQNTRQWWLSLRILFLASHLLTQSVSIDCNWLSSLVQVSKFSTFLNHCIALETSCWPLQFLAQACSSSQVQQDGQEPCCLGPGLSSSLYEPPLAVYGATFSFYGSQMSVAAALSP